MWNTKDSNKQVGYLMKVMSNGMQREYFKKHLIKMNQIKSELNLQKCRPWRPSFSISKKQNRFIRDQRSMVEYNNDQLIKKLSDIDERPIVKTVLQLPYYIPSHKSNYLKFKQRERNKQLREVSRQNLKVFNKIFTAQTSYSRNKLEKSWMQNRLHKKNISKLQKCLDYREQATRSLNSSRTCLSTNNQKRNKISSSQNKKQLINNHLATLSMRESVRSKFKHLL